MLGVMITSVIEDQMLNVFVVKSFLRFTVVTEL